MAGPVLRSAVPAATLCAEQVRVRRDVAGDADVDHDDAGAGLRGQDVHDGAPGQEVGDHLPGHLLRPRADALRVHAVVAGEDRDRGRLGQRCGRGPGQTGELHGQVLQHAEAAARLGQPVLVVTRLGGRGGVQRAQLVEQREQVGGQVGTGHGRSWGSAAGRGQPATARDPTSPAVPPG